MMIVLAFGNVEAVLDDRRREQDVVLPRDEIEHRPLQLVLVHLPVADDDARLRNEPLQQIRRSRRSTRRGCGRSRPGRRAPSRRGSLADDLRVELDDVGLDRQPILRRRLDDRHVADADERHVQRARNRRRVIVSTSTFCRSCLSRSLWATPKRCSSSMTSRPRSRNWTSFDSSGACRR